jgi:hypothetical protein
MKLTTEIKFDLTLTFVEMTQLREELENLFNFLGENQWKGSFEVLVWRLIDTIQDAYQNDVQDESGTITLTLEEAKELKSDIEEIDIERRGNAMNQLWDILWNGISAV